jgi:serine/threonine protein kinase/Tol biopolymer transport system component
MSLAPGTRLGPYEVISPLGAGGMGEVYRARDAKLGREVAIKILPDLFAQDPERLARFEREARTLAALNHPNIAHIYGVEDTAGVRALVMELVEGEDLSTLIARGSTGSEDPASKRRVSVEIRQGPADSPNGVASQAGSAGGRVFRRGESGIPLAEVLPIARQLADAIEAAHEQGVIHRDLKPANIKVRDDGTVKVLDFGLAKALDPVPTSGAGVAAANSPTFTARATELGIILGTAAYMAPEQARGKAVDRRADIWSFGVVLTELLTGERAFPGEDVSAVLAKVIEREPDFSRLPADTPPSLRRLLVRCLVKDPKQRLRDIGEARIALSEAVRELAEGPSSMSAAVAPMPLLAKPIWRRALPWALVAALLIALVAVFARDRTTPTTPAVITRLQIALPPSVELYTFTGASVCLSPNGSTIAFVGVGAGDGVRRVYQRRLDQFEITPVRGTETASSCAFSPDGRELLVGISDSSLRRIRLSDGLIETVATATTWFAGGAWLPNGRVVFTKDNRLWISGETPGAAPTRLTDTQAGSTAAEVQPVAVPGGKAVLFVSTRPEAPDSGRIEALSLTDKARTTIVERGSLPVLTRTGHLLFLRDGVLLAAPFDVQSLKTTGDAMPMLHDLGVVGRMTGATANIAVSETGVLAYVSTTSVQSEIVSVSRTGEEQILLSNQRPAANPRLSPNGRRLLLLEEIGAGLRVWDLERGTSARLAEGFPQASFPVFARGGLEVVFCLANGLFRQPIDGSAKPVQIAGSDANEYPNGMTPHDADVLFTKITAATSGDVYALPLAGGKERALINTAGYEGGAQISPDANWMVYVSNELGGGYEVFLQPYPALSLEHRQKVSSAGGIHPVWNPVWSPKGGEIFYRSGDKMMSVRLTVTAAGAASLEPPRELFSGRYAFGNGNTMANFSVTSDGQRFILVKQSGASLNVVVNWFEELKRVR